MREWLIYYVGPDGKPGNKVVQSADVFTAIMAAAIPHMWIKSIKEVHE
jgi:hypothetical protein